MPTLSSARARGAPAAAVPSFARDRRRVALEAVVEVGGARAARGGHGLERREARPRPGVPPPASDQLLLVLKRGTNITSRRRALRRTAASSVDPNASIRDGSEREPKSNFSSSPPAELLRTIGSSEVGGIT